MVPKLEIYHNNKWLDITPHMIADSVKIKEGLYNSEKSVINMCKLQLKDAHVSDLGTNLAKYFFNQKGNIYARVVDTSKLSNHTVTGFSLVSNTKYDAGGSSWSITISDGYYKGKYYQGITGTFAENSSLGFIYVDDNGIHSSGTPSGTNPKVLYVIQNVRKHSSSNYWITTVEAKFNSTFFNSSNKGIFSGIIRPTTKLTLNDAVQYIDLEIRDQLFLLNQKSKKEVFICRGWTKLNGYTVDDFLEHVFNLSNGYLDEQVFFSRGAGVSRDADSLLIKKDEDIKNVIDKYLYQYGLVLQANPDGRLTTKNVLSTVPSGIVFDESAYAPEIKLSKKENKHGIINYKYGKINKSNKIIGTWTVGAGSVLDRSEGRTTPHNGYHTPIKTVGTFSKTTGTQLLDNIKTIKITASIVLTLDIGGSITNLPSIKLFEWFNKGTSWTSNETYKVIARQQESQGKYVMQTLQQYNIQRIETNGRTYVKKQIETESHINTSLYSSPVNKRADAPFEYEFALLDFSVLGGNLICYMSYNVTNNGSGSIRPSRGNEYKKYLSINITADTYYNERLKFDKQILLTTGDPSETKTIELYNIANPTKIDELGTHHYEHLTTSEITLYQDIALGTVAQLSNTENKITVKCLVVEKKYTLMKADKQIYNYKLKLLEKF